jgi:hypothetical protein
MKYRCIPARGACSVPSRGLVALVCSARYLMSEPAREGPNERKKGENTSADRPPTHSDAWVAWERCSGTARVVVYLYPKLKPRTP